MLFDSFTQKKKIWFMRQAGRHLPEYLELRKNAGSFLDLCYNPELAAEATMQPIKRYNIDAAIIFSDILVILDALGCKTSFVKGEGPKIEKDLEKFISDNLKKEDIEEKITKNLEPVYEAIRLTRKQLPKDKSLIGFAGAFWTLLTYFIEGQGSKVFAKTKRFIYEEPEKLEKLQEILCYAISIHLKNQIKAGCDTIKIFDSWAGVLSISQIKNLVNKPFQKILKNLEQEKAKKILFPRGISALDIFCEDLQNYNYDCLAVDYCFDIKNAKNLQQKYKKVIQGNLDPYLLAFGRKEKIKNEVNYILENTKDIEHIFNLGHGIIPETPIENVEMVVDLVNNSN